MLLAGVKMDLDFCFFFVHHRCRRCGGDGGKANRFRLLFFLIFKKVTHEDPFRLNHAHGHLRIWQIFGMYWVFFFFCQMKSPPSAYDEAYAIVSLTDANESAFLPNLSH
jgi:hypothetical protein